MKQQLPKILLLLVMSVILIQSALAASVSVLTTDPAPLQAGDFADITVQVSSAINEDRYDQVTLSIEETNYITVISDNQKRWSNFESGRSVTHTFRVFLAENLPSGGVDFSFLIETDEATFTSEERLFVQESDSKPELHIGSIKTTPKELLPDTDDNEIRITVQNLGDKDAELVKATLETNSNIVKSSYSYSLQDSVASIQGGSEQELTFTIDIEETILTEIPSTLTLQYRTKSASGSEYETVTTEIPFNLEIIEAPLLKIVEVKQVDSFAGGSAENELLVGIKNEGTTKAEEVRVRLVPDVSYPFLFELTTKYVSSSIEPGETAYVSFVAEVQDSAEDRDYTITTKLESLIGETRYVREDVLDITTKAKKPIPVKTISLIIIGVIILVGIFIGYGSYKQNKKPRRVKRS